MKDGLSLTYDEISNGGEIMTDSDSELNPRTKWLIGVGITFFMAVVGYIIALLPGFSLIGPQRNYCRNHLPADFRLSLYI